MLLSVSRNMVKSMASISGSPLDLVIQNNYQNINPAINKIKLVTCNFVEKKLGLLKYNLCFLGIKMGCKYDILAVYNMIFILTPGFQKRHQLIVLCLHLELSGIFTHIVIL